MLVTSTAVSGGGQSLLTLGQSWSNPHLPILGRSLLTLGQSWGNPHLPWGQSLLTLGQSWGNPHLPWGQSWGNPYLHLGQSSLTLGAILTYTSGNPHLQPKCDHCKCENSTLRRYTSTDNIPGRLKRFAMRQSIL